MRRMTMKHFAISSALVGLMLTAAVAGAQVGVVKRLPGKRAGSSASQALSRPVHNAGMAVLQLHATQLSGQLSTVAICINKGACTSKTEIVGAYGVAAELYQAGFLARASGTSISDRRW